MYLTAISKNKNSQGKGTQLKKAPPAKVSLTTGSPVSKILQLQQTIGNQATQMIVREVFSNSHSASEAIPHNSSHRSPGVIGSPLIQRVKKGGGGSLSSGVVKITQDNHTLYLCSQDKADELQKKHTDAIRFDLRSGLDDAIPDPKKYQDVLSYMTFLGAQIGKAFTQSDTIIINCKSGKTRTPTIAIIYQFLKTGDMKGAINTIAEEFKSQRPEVGIDYDAKLTGARILDESGIIKTDAPKLEEISNRFRSFIPEGESTDFSSIAERIFTQSNKRKRGSRFTKGWKAWEKGSVRYGPPRGITKTRKMSRRKISPRRVRELLAMARGWGYIQ